MGRRQFKMVQHFWIHFIIFTSPGKLTTFLQKFLSSSLNFLNKNSVKMILWWKYPSYAFFVDSNNIALEFLVGIFFINILRFSLKFQMKAFIINAWRKYTMSHLKLIEITILFEKFVNSFYKGDHCSLWSLMINVRLE